MRADFIPHSHSRLKRRHAYQEYIGVCVSITSRRDALVDFAALLDGPGSVERPFIKAFEQKRKKKHGGTFHACFL